MLSTFIHQRKYWNQSLVAEENLVTIKLDKSAGKCNCQLRIFVLPVSNTVRKLYFYKLNSFSVLTLPVNVKIFDRKFGGISFLTCESTETGAVANFPFVNGRCHFSERSLPFETVDAIYNGRLHTSLQRKLKETN